MQLGTRRLVRMGLIGLLLGLSRLSVAQSTTPEDEYKKLIKVNEDIQPLGDSPFGEQFSLYDGTMSFEQTDVSMAGLGPTLSVVRRFHFYNDGERMFLNENAFGDWDLNIPRITTDATFQNNVQGWMVESATNQLAICSNFRAPPTVQSLGGGKINPDAWTAEQWWHGYQLVIPGQGEQEMLSRTVENANSPQVDGKTFNIVTKNNWAIGCSSDPVENDATREGFYAMSPDGTRYTFRHLAYREGTTLNRATGDERVEYIARKVASMYVTRIEDRFGRGIDYHYDASDRLATIHADDGREVALNYVGDTPRVDTIVQQPGNAAQRVWQYTYTDYTIPGMTATLPGLSDVRLPDNSHWSIAFRDFALDAVPSTEGQPGNCRTALVQPYATYVGTITHPSGLVGTFTVGTTRRGRSQVPEECESFIANAQFEDGHAVIPKEWYTESLVRKEYAGAGLPAPQVWTYTYSPANDSWQADCTASGCATTVWTSETAPDGHSTRSTFSNVYDITEGSLLTTETFPGAPDAAPAIRTEAVGYAAPDGGPYPVKVGATWQNRTNVHLLDYYRPQNLRTVVQDGDTYTWAVEAFDAFAHPSVVRRERANGLSVREQTNYLNSLPLWLLDVVQSTVNLTENETVSAMDYAADGTPATRYVFGVPVMNYTFSNGELAAFTELHGIDGDTTPHTTQLADYKRGIPQSITFPDGTVEGISVDDFGQVASVTDQNGNLTGYSYDPAGRLAQIRYPTGDSQAWNNRDISYEFIGTDERGLAASHWRRTLTQGDLVQRTFYDAKFNPVLSERLSASNPNVHTTTHTSVDYRGNPVFEAFAQTGEKNLADFSDAGGTSGGTTTAYDALGRAVQKQTPLEDGTFATSTTAYQAGAQTVVTDPRGGQTTTTFQVFDEPSFDKPLSIAGPESILQTIVRDTYGNPKSITQSGPGVTPVVKTFVYDPLHQVCRTTEPETASSVQALDNLGNVLWSASGVTVVGDGCGFDAVTEAQKVSRTYDALNRVTGINYGDGTAPSTMTYTPTGKPLAAIAGSVEWNYVYNKRDLLTGETLSLHADNRSWSFGHGYDANGNVAATTYPDGQSVAYLPDALGQPTQASAYATGAQYFADGDPSYFVFGNGTEYSAAKTVRNLTHNFSYLNGSTTALSHEIGYDPDGNITGVTDLVGTGQRSRAFSYDLLNRLTGASSDGLGFNDTYTYDPLNNLSRVTSNGVANDYAYDGSNRLNGVSSAGVPISTFVYDNRGNVVSKNSVPYVFDGADRLTSITGLEDYLYDASGRRVKKSVPNGATTYYAYSSTGSLMWEYDPASETATRYVYLGKKMVAEAKVDAAALDPAKVSGTVTLVGVPTLSADKATVSVTVDVANTGTVAWPAGGRDPVRVGARLVDATGADQNANLPRTNLTADLAPGDHVSVILALPASQVIGTPNLLSIVPVQEGVAWFDTWGTVPVKVGPFSDCGFASTYLCNEEYTLQPNQAAVSLTLVSAPSLSADGQSMTAVVDVANNGTIVLTGRGTHPVNLGSHFADAAGNSLQTDVARVGLPDVAPGTHVELTIASPASGLIGQGAALQFELAHESVQWFRDYGYPPIGNGATYGMLSAPAQSSTPDYTVQWTAVPGATAYVLQEQVNGRDWSTVQTADALSWAASAHGVGTYAYRMQPCASACGPFTPVQTTSVVYIPPAPEAISVPATSTGAIAIGWSGSATATRYELEQDFNGGGFANIFNGNALSYSYATAGSGTYTYRVRACNDVGCSGYGPSGSSVVTYPPSAAPAISGPGSSTNGCYTINWGGVDSATSYNIQEQTNGGGWVGIGNDGSGALGVCGKGDGSYAYQVQACNAGGCGPWSATVSVSVSIIPAVPGDLRVTVLSPPYKGRYTVTWGGVAGATRYEVKLQSPNEIDYPYSGADTTFTSILLNTTGSVEFWVRACNANGCSDWSLSTSEQFSSQ